MTDKIEGVFEDCQGHQCGNSCCQYGFGESMEEFNQSPRPALLEDLKAFGVRMETDRGFIRVTGCSDGKDCLLLKEFGRFGDVRPLACKIYPYYIARRTDGKVEIDLHPCPSVSAYHDIPERYTNQTVKLIQDHFLLLFDQIVNVVVIPAQIAADSTT